MPVAEAPGRDARVPAGEDARTPLKPVRSASVATATNQDRGVFMRMMRMMMRIAVSVFVLLLAASAAFAQSKERADIPEGSKWKITDLYASDDAWRVAKDKLAARIPEVKKFKG